MVRASSTCIWSFRKITPPYGVEDGTGVKLGRGVEVGFRIGVSVFVNLMGLLLGMGIGVGVWISVSSVGAGGKVGALVLVDGLGERESSQAPTSKMTKINVGKR